MTAKETYDKFKVGVQDGMVLFDLMIPGWHNRIDVRRLKMQSFTDCILGQLYGFPEKCSQEEYHRRFNDFCAFAKTICSDLLATKYGLFAEYYDFPRLSRTWKAAILRRRKLALTGSDERLQCPATADENQLELVSTT